MSAATKSASATNSPPLRKRDSSLFRRKFNEAMGRIAQPGDLCFFITDGTDPLNYASWKPRWLRNLLRRWYGFANEDDTTWHVGILSKFKKHNKHAQIRPYIIHSKAGGVREEHISPKWIFSERDSEGRPEKRIITTILRYENITPSQSHDLVTYCKNRIGKAFPTSLRGEDLTYVFGLPNFLRSPDEYACHWLIYDAFESISVSFPHQVSTFPFFNIGKYLGHPFGHKKNKVNPRFPYLRDHHLYRDARLQCVLLVYVDPLTGGMRISEYPEKYSWDSKLAATYNIEDS